MERKIILFEIDDWILTEEEGLYFVYWKDISTVPYKVFPTEREAVIFCDENTIEEN